MKKILISAVVVFSSCLIVIATLFFSGVVGFIPYNPENNKILHHVALTPSDMEKSLAFYKEGIGLQEILDMDLNGDWPGLFNARSDKLRAVFLGDPKRPDAGIVELVYFEGGHDKLPVKTTPEDGFFLISFVVDVDETVKRLQSLGFAKDAIIGNPSPGTPDIAVLRDPDGVLVELIPFAFYAIPPGE